DERLHEPGVLRRCQSPQDRPDGQLCYTHGYASGARLPFAHPDPGEGWIYEHAKRHEPPLGRPVSAAQVVPDDAKVVERDMGELRAPCALADPPGVGRRRLQAFVHPNVATS